MGTKHDAETGLNFDSRGICRNCRLPKTGIQKTNHIDFPAHSFPYYGCEIVGKILIPSSIKTPNSCPLSSALVPHSGQAQKTFTAFGHSSDQTNLLFSSGYPQFRCPNLPNVCLDLSGSSSSSNQSIELHEDTEEINALLYSDSYAVSFGDDEVSTGRSPLDTVEHINEVDISFMSNKRRRLNIETDDPLTDTASSALLHFPEDHPHEFDCGDGSSFVNGDLVPVCRMQCDVPITDSRLHETVDMLRGIIPEGKGNDVVSVLDEAIQYLKYLKREAEAIGSISSLAKE